VGEEIEHRRTSRLRLNRLSKKTKLPEK
jgi:hypothetical protein